MTQKIVNVSEIEGLKIRGSASCLNQEGVMEKDEWISKDDLRALLDKSPSVSGEANTQEAFEKWAKDAVIRDLSMSYKLPLTVYLGHNQYANDRTMSAYAGWQACQAHNDAVIASKDMAIENYESKIAARDEALQGANAVIAELVEALDDAAEAMIKKLNAEKG